MTEVAGEQANGISSTFGQWNNNRGRHIEEKTSIPDLDLQILWETIYNMQTASS